MGKASTRLTAGLGVLLLTSSLVWGDPGFSGILGQLEKKIKLSIREPSKVRLANTSIAFTGAPSGPIVTTLLANVETELLANERTLVKKANPSEAEWVLAFRVTANSVAPPRQRVESNGKGTTAYARWSGSLRVSYQILDHGGRALDAANITSSYDREFAVAGGNIGTAVASVVGKKNREPHSQEDVQGILVDDVVAQISKKLKNTSKTLDVQVATGEDHLNRAYDFMHNRLWSRALDELEKTPEFKKPESEAYRQYDLGLVHEAMSYDAKQFKDQEADLFAAQEYYDKALEMNRKEKYFVVTVARIKDGMARYKAFEAQQKGQPAAKQAPAPVAQVNPPAATPAAPKTVAKVQNPAPKATPPPAAPPKSKSKTIGATDVIEMFTSGVPEAQIIDIIQHSPVQFDPLDKDTAVAIARAKLPLTLQNELRKRVNAPLLGPASAASKK